MNKVKSMESARLKAVTAAVLAALVTLTIGAIGVGKAYAKDSEHKEITVGGYTFDAWTDYGVNDEAYVGTSVFIMKYSGSDTELILPVTFTSDGVTYPGTFVNKNTGSTFHGEMMLDGDTFKGNTKIEKVAIPAGISVVGQEAFSGCTSLFVFNFKCCR